LLLKGKNYLGAAFEAFQEEVFVNVIFVKNIHLCSFLLRYLRPSRLPLSRIFWPAFRLCS